MSGTFKIVLLLAALASSQGHAQQQCDLSVGPCTITGAQGPPGPAGSGSVQAPGGRLTLTQGQPVPVADAIGAQTLWYAPYRAGSRVPVLDASLTWQSVSFVSGHTDSSGLSVSGGAKWGANSQRDVFVGTSGSAAFLCTGPAWPAADFAARGLAQYDGLPVNGAAMTCDTGAASSVTCPQYRCTWVGSINVGAAAGQLTAHVSMGPLRRRDAWNAYNQQPIRLLVMTSVMQSPFYYLPTNQYPNFQIFNGDQGARGTAFTGAPEVVDVDYHQGWFLNSGSSPALPYGIISCVGWNGACSGTWNVFSDDAPGFAGAFMGTSNYVAQAAVGANDVSMMIAAAVNSANTGSAVYGNLSIPWPASADHYSRMDVKYDG